jgi:hypothetical protein
MHNRSVWVEGKTSDSIITSESDREVWAVEQEGYGGQVIGESMEGDNRKRILLCCNALRFLSNEEVEFLGRLLSPR